MYTLSAMAEEDAHLSKAQKFIASKNLAQAEAVLLDHLKHAEQDDEARFLLARVYSWQNKWEESLEQFDVLLTKKPNSTDLLLARANTLEWMGHRKQALYDLAKARELSPNYSEIWRSEIIILQRDNTPASKSKALSLISQAKNNFPEESWDELLVIENKIISERSSYAAEFIYGYDKLTNNRSPWSTRSVKLSRVSPDKHFSHIRLDSVERFDLEDWQVAGSYALPFLKSWNFYTAATYSPTHNVLANRMIDTNLSKSFKSGTILSGGISNARYNLTSSQQIHLGGEHYWSVFRMAYTYRRINVLNAGTGVNHSVQANYYYSPTAMLGIAAATGKDVEFDGTSSPPISDVRTYSIYGFHMFKPQWSLIYSIFHHQQGDFYNRNGFVVGIKFDF